MVRDWHRIHFRPDRSPAFLALLTRWRQSKTRLRPRKSLIRFVHDSCLSLNAIRRIDHVLLMIDREDSAPVHLDFDPRLVTARKPKSINSLILPDKVSSIDPEGQFFSRVAGDFNNRKILCVDPYFPFKQILLIAFRGGLENKAMIRADFLFSGEREHIVRGRDRAVKMLPTG